MNFNYYLQYLYSKNTMHFVRYCFSNVNFHNLKSGQSIEIKAVSDPKDELFLQALSEFKYPSILDYSEAEKRFEYGFYCYLGLIKGHPVSYTWIAQDSCYIPYLDGTIILKPGERYEFNAVVNPKYRGQGIYNHLRSMVFDDLKNNHSVQSVIGAHMSWNKATQRANEKFGVEFLGSVIYGYIGTIRYFYNSVKNVEVVHHGKMLQLYTNLLK